jgi:hypothetical protein
MLDLSASTVDVRADTIINGLGACCASFAVMQGIPMHDVDDQQFEACLPQVARSVRITCLHDAQVFARRWVIRDKDPALKALVRCLEKAHSAEASAHALHELRGALAARGLLPQAATT